MKKNALCLMLMLTIGTVSLSAATANYQVEFFTPAIVRIIKTPGDQPVNKQSLVVNTKPEKVKVAALPENLFRVVINQ